MDCAVAEYLREGRRPDAGLKLPRLKIAFAASALKVFAARPARLARCCLQPQTLRRIAAKQALKACGRVASMSESLWASDAASRFEGAGGQIHARSSMARCSWPNLAVSAALAPRSCAPGHHRGRSRTLALMWRR